MKMLKLVFLLVCCIRAKVCSAHILTALIILLGLLWLSLSWIKLCLPVWMMNGLGVGSCMQLP